jgi:hypothetical protein
MVNLLRGERIGVGGNAIALIRKYCLNILLRGERIGVGGNIKVAGGMPDTSILAKG